RVRDHFGRSIGHHRAGKSLGVAIDRIEEVDAEPALGVPTTEGDAVFELGERSGCRDAYRIVRAGSRGRATVSAALVGRVGGALVTGAREVERRLVRLVPLSGEVELPALTDRAVVFVGEHDDRQERARPEEVLALLEKHIVGAARHNPLLPGIALDGDVL